MKRAQSQKDKFETLCYVKADISSASYEAICGDTPEKVVYKRRADVILLVSPKELKVQMSWIDPETVCAHVVLRVFIYLTQPPDA